MPGSDDPTVARTTEPLDAPRPARPGYDLFVALAVTTTASLPVFLVATLAIEIRQSLHFGASALGVAVSLYYLGAAVGSVPLSRVVERVGGVRVLRVACLTSAVLLVLLGTVTSSWLILAALLVPCGISSAAIAPASNLFLARRIRPARQGAAFGVKQAAIPLASLVGGLSVPAVALTLGVTIHLPCRLKQGPDHAIREVASDVLEFQACRIRVVTSSKPSSRHYAPRTHNRPVRSPHKPVKSNACPARSLSWSSG